MSEQQAWGGWWDGEKWHEAPYPRGRWVGEGLGFRFTLRSDLEPGWFRRLLLRWVLGVRWRPRRDDE